MKKSKKKKKKIGVLFDGQGGQHMAMGQDFFNNCPNISYFYETLANKLKISTEELFNMGEEKVNETYYAQPLIFTFESVVSSCLKEDLSKSGTEVEFYSYGFSLGLYSSLIMDESNDFNELIDVVIHRGQYMEEACKKCEQTMAATFTSEVPIVEYVCSLFSKEELAIANFNSPKQIVIGGKKVAVEKAIKLFECLGIKSSLLNVQGAFHTPLMNTAFDSFQRYLRSRTNKLNIPSDKVIIDEAIKDYMGEINDLLSEQIRKRTNLNMAVHEMLEKGVRTFVEIGPSRPISRFVEQISPSSRILSINDLASFNSCIKYLTENITEK